MIMPNTPARSIIIWPTMSSCLEFQSTCLTSASICGTGSFRSSFNDIKLMTTAATSMMMGRYQYLATLILMYSAFFFSDSGCVMEIVQKNNADMRQAHTESSKTAAMGEFSLNMIIASRALVAARPSARSEKAPCHDGKESPCHQEYQKYDVN